MTAPFECEVRFFLRDHEAFQRRLTDLGGRVRRVYAFTDHYHRPAAPSGGRWDPRTQALRIREHQVTERVEGLGWMGEIEREGRDPTRAAEEIRRALALLGVPEEEVTGEPMAVLAASAGGGEAEVRPR